VEVLQVSVNIFDVRQRASKCAPQMRTHANRRAEKAYPNLIHYNRLPKGGHFAAWEQPKLFSEEIRTGFRSVRPHAVKSALDAGQIAG
jgi:hypothetical protein